MSARLVFRCDHDGCTNEHVEDTTDEEIRSGSRPGLLINLAPLLRFLTDTHEGEPGWEFACDVLPGGLLLFKACFCPEHREDIKSMAGYKPDELSAARKAREGQRGVS